MSALSTSSPTISPSPRGRTYHYSSRSPRPTTTTTPHRSAPTRALHSPTPSSISSVSPKSFLPRHKERGGDSSSANKGPRPRYADAGTQYSPEGYPPTAGHQAGATDAAQEALTQGRKRKEDARERSPSPPMSPGSRIVQFPPPSAAEPSLRVDPAAANTQQKQLEPVPAAEEPQEARSTAHHSSTPKRPRGSPTTVKPMPRAYETCNPKDLGVLISNMLMELIRLNDQIPLRDGRLTRFHSRAPPGISVADYLQRLIQHATLPPPILLSMVYYIDRLCAMYSAFTINSLTVHRFLITAATVAAKGLSDSFWTNPTYARIGGIPVSELATLELEFLQKVQWKIVPRPETLVDYYVSLVDRTEGYVLEGGEGESSEGSSVDEEERDGMSVDREPT